MVLMTSFEPVKKLLFVGSLSLAVMTGSAPEVYGSETQVPGITNSQPAPSTEAAKPERHSVQPTRLYLGSAPYICTLSGFGRTARCFLRASVQERSANQQR
jgi:hypothetical protein